MSRLRVATFNVNGIRSRLPHLLQWLERERPDIACLQELKAADDAFPRDEIATAGYGARWHGQRSWNGVAILARGAEPIETRRGLPGDPDDTHSRYLEAVAHGVVVGCLYLPNGNPQPGPKFDYKLRWFARLIEHARTLLSGGHPVVLAGDFNVVPTDDLDIYNPKSWRRDALLQPESRACWFELLEQGWTDALRTLHPDERIYTFWDYFRQHWPRDAGLRIDHLLLSPVLSDRLVAAGVDRWVRGLEGASDHAPTWVELDVDGSGSATGKRGSRSATSRPADPAPARRAQGKGAPASAAETSQTKPVSRAKKTKDSTPAGQRKPTASASKATRESAAPRESSAGTKQAAKKRGWASVKKG